MEMSQLRVLGGIVAGVAVIAALWAIGWNHPRLACALMLSGFGVGWAWFIVRSIKTGSVMVRSGRYFRTKSPIAYWAWLGFFFLIGVYLLLGGTYALIKR